VATDRWSELPADPLGCDGDRSIVATPDSLVLFGVPCPEGAGGAGPRLYHAARFDLATGAWHRIVDSGIAGGSPCWVLSGDLVVNPTPGTVDGGVVDPYDRPYPTGGVLDLGSETWSSLAGPASDPDPGAPQPTVSADTGYLGAAGAWVAAGTRLYEPISGTWHTVPPGPEVAWDRAVVWTGEEIIAWGGTDERYERHVATGVAYTPPVAPAPPS